MVLSVSIANLGRGREDNYAVRNTIGFLNDFGVWSLFGFHSFFFGMGFVYLVCTQVNF